MRKLGSQGFLEENNSAYLTGLLHQAILLGILSTNQYESLDQGRGANKLTEHVSREELAIYLENKDK